MYTCYISISIGLNKFKYQCSFEYVCVMKGGTKQVAFFATRVTIARGRLVLIP